MNYEGLIFEGHPVIPKILATNSVAFFRNDLHALLRSITAWGAMDKFGRVFLRVWSDPYNMQQFGNTPKVRVGFGAPNSPNRNVVERFNHIEAIRRGAPAYGVVCTAKEAHPSPIDVRHIKYFQKSPLLQLGEITLDRTGYPKERGDILYANIIREVQLSEVLTLQH